MQNIFSLPIIAAILCGLAAFGLIYFFWQTRMESLARAEVRKRLEIKSSRSGKKAGTTAAGKMAIKVAARTDRFYSARDPEHKRTIQLKLVQAGFHHPQALGLFLAARLASAIVFAAVGLMIIVLSMPNLEMSHKMIVALLFLTFGYFLPNIIMNRRLKTRVFENRSGFPDVMDLMIIASEAGLTTEASIEKIAHEIQSAYPVLSQQLMLAAAEIRAGKPLDEALHAFGDRVGLEEVGGFATMIKQSKELGSSVADALRVFSDEMRHKRMMAAEEKAHALPAKLSIPVTVFILPIVIGVAVTPTIIRLVNAI